jgi:hypothetical protein
VARCWYDDALAKLNLVVNFFMLTFELTKQLDMNIVDFLVAKPKVTYLYADGTTKTWEFRWSGMFGQGYYRLTKNGRRHPMSYFKVAKQVFLEYMDGQCVLVEEKNLVI